MDKAICNTILFLISSPKLKRNTLAENLNLDDLIKFVLAYEQFRHTAALLKPCAVSPDPDDSVAALEEDVRRLKQKGLGSTLGKCDTCTFSTHSTGKCPVVDKECFLIK